MITLTRVPCEDRFIAYSLQYAYNMIYHIRKIKIKTSKEKDTEIIDLVILMMQKYIDGDYTPRKDILVDILEFLVTEEQMTNELIESIKKSDIDRDYKSYVLQEYANINKDIKLIHNIIKNAMIFASDKSLGEQCDETDG